VRRKILRRGSVRIGLTFVRGLWVLFVEGGRLRILVMLFQVISLGGVRFVMRDVRFVQVMNFFALGRLLQSLIVEPGGVGQRLARQDFHRRTDRRRQGRGGTLRLLMRMHRVVVFQVFENVANVQKRVAVEADIHESRLHAGKDAGDFSFIDAADQRELFFALDVNFD
jgi:hypothetical protein